MHGRAPRTTVKDLERPHQLWGGGGGGGGGGVNRFSDRRISQKKLFGFRIWRIFYTDLWILLIQRIADLSNILARIVDLACRLVRILDCDFIVELLAGFKFSQDYCRIADFASNLGGSADLYTPIHPPPLAML
jgi:hypothetical protein